MNLVIRADAGPEIGGGHVMRSRAVAEALIGSGSWDACIATRDETVSDVARLSGGLPPVPLECSVDAEADLLMRQLPEGCDILLVDHYERGYAFERACREWAKTIAVIDDFPNREHRCDLLIDATLGRSVQDYDGRVPEDAIVLAGPYYAALRPQFAQARWDGPAAHTTQRRPRVLVALSAMDADNFTSLVLDALDMRDAELNVDVVLSSGAPHLDKVRRKAKTSSHDVRVHIDIADMASLMAAADLAVGAGGGSAWERCCLGLPTVALQIADNQRDVIAALVAAKAVTTVDPIGADTIGARIDALLSDPLKLREMSLAATSLTDGIGARRVALELIETLTPRSGQRLRLRPVAETDAALLLDLQRDPETRRYARNRAVPSSTEHQAWFTMKRGDPGCIFHMLEESGAMVGFLRLDRDNARSAFEISIAVVPEKRGGGIGRAALGLAASLLPEQRLLAQINSDNQASVRMFAAAGYRPIGDDWYERPTTH